MSTPFDTLPLTPLRKTIAARMAEAKRTIPHFRLSADVELDALRAWRLELKVRQPGNGPTLNDLLIKACAGALMEVPEVNVQWADTEIHRYRSADISVAMALEGGVSTPIVRNADAKSIWSIAREVADLGSRAARNELRMSQILGGSFTISNLGMYGVDQFDAIINMPQCAILAMGAAKPRLVVDEAGSTRVARVARMTLAVDHRAIDGVTAARFLDALRRRLEQPRELRLEAAEAAC